MKKCFKIIINYFCLLPFLIVAQQNDTIIWSYKNKLTYTDFEHKPEINSKFKAVSHLEYPCSYKFIGDTLYIYAFCYFSKNKSWFSKDSIAKSNYDIILLSHEQGHFNIGEIEMRKFRKKLLEAPITAKNVGALIKELSDQMFGAERNMQSIYDKETALSTNKEKQKEWELKLKQQLKELDAYANVVIKVPWKKH
jgi:hypothetical protein